MRIIAFTSGYKVPSAIYRIREYLDYLRELNINVDEYYPYINKNEPPPYVPTGLQFKYIAPYVIFWFLFKLSFRVRALLKQSEYDVAWLNREFLPGLYTLERFIKIPYVLDFDDAIWLSKPKGEDSFKLLCENAAHIVAGNDFLAEKAMKYNVNVSVIPTSVDTNKIYPLNLVNLKFTLGWVGTAANFIYLYDIEMELVEFLEKTESQLLIVSNIKPVFSNLVEGKHWKFRLWDKNDENIFFNEIDVGIMPLAESDWEKGKCSFKMLQYLAAGKPVVVSPVGTNVNILNKGNCGLFANANEWADKLSILYYSCSLRAEMGLRGRNFVCDNYSIEANIDKLRTIFEEVANEKRT